MQFLASVKCRHNGNYLIMLNLLPIDIIARENPSQSQRYITADAKNLMRWYKIMTEQQNLCTMLRNANIHFAVVKGASAASHYTNPQRRTFGDIDILVLPESFDTACSLVSDGAEYIGENSRHKEYKRNGIVVEIHQAFSTFRDTSKKEIFDQRIFNSILSAETVSVENFTFPRLPVAEHGLTLL